MIRREPYGGSVPLSRTPSAPPCHKESSRASLPDVRPRGPVFSVLDGSFPPCALADFRTQSLFSAFWTEVLLSVPLPTSVPEACFQHFGRKFPALHPCRLPYPSPVFHILNGSFMPCSPADFRTQAPFSAFWTEVSRPAPLQTSVPKPRFPHFGRKFPALYPC